MQLPQPHQPWVKIIEHPDPIHMEAIRQLLEVHELQPVVINKKDVYGLTGMVELYVVSDFAFRARQIIHEHYHE